MTRVRDNRTVALDGERLRAVRQERGLSRQTLAERGRGNCSLTATTIKRAENGERVYASTLSILAQLLEVEPSSLVKKPPGNVTEAGHLGSDDVTRVSPAERNAGEEVSVPASELHLATIAVQPFHALGREAQSFADGIADDLIVRLCRLWFPVISRGSTLGAREVAEPLDADYLVHGSVRLAGDSIRASVQLIHRATNEVVWGDTYDSTFRNLFECQDRFTTRIVNGVGDSLLVAETKLYSGRDPSDLEAWQLGLLGAWHFYRRTREANREARELLQAAVRRDRFQPLAWYTLALTYQQDLLRQWSSDPRASLEQMASVSSELAGLYPTAAGSHVAAAYVQVYRGARDSAMAHLTEALSLDPNMVNAYSLYGQTLAMAAEADRAIEQFEVGLRLGPRDSERWALHVGVSLSHFVAERYEDAIAAAHQAIPISPGIAFPFGVLASSHAHLGNAPEAREALTRMLELEPQTTATGFGAIIKSTKREIAERYLGGLRRAGMGP
jgi:TolB-like protein/tetratricopeptide (TPR) repeat protein